MLRKKLSAPNLRRLQSATSSNASPVARSRTASAQGSVASSFSTSTTKLGAESWEKQTLVQLKHELKTRRLPVSGNKAQLIERLTASDATVTSAPSLKTKTSRARQTTAPAVPVIPIEFAPASRVTVDLVTGAISTSTTASTGTPASTKVTLKQLNQLVSQTPKDLRSVKSTPNLRFVSSSAPSRAPATEQSSPPKDIPLDGEGMLKVSQRDWDEVNKRLPPNAGRQVVYDVPEQSRTDFHQLAELPDTRFDHGKAIAIEVGPFIPSMPDKPTPEGQEEEDGEHFVLHTQKVHAVTDPSLRHSAGGLSVHASGGEEAQASSHSTLSTTSTGAKIAQRGPGNPRRSKEDPVPGTEIKESGGEDVGGLRSLWKDVMQDIGLASKEPSVRHHEPDAVAQTKEKASEVASDVSSRAARLLGSLEEVTGIKVPPLSQPIEGEAKADSFKPEQRELYDDERRGVLYLAGIVLGGFGLSSLLTRESKPKTKPAA
ncbi:uncharacterized protein L969DRAFT_591006 [Mixia osmundae IAM 14324]|uniref:SAP domain-containing protein n=1 Tax=Mixia osmundae (strain CBS 9802 / IAM 14324 / JCM 22182 / KY 12970) TaxID=764103 RepID=G7EA37_MIXOS|nr:uncharacterized protein L969DRAFT_591006 [Mixia osmundae IAM 14324]KEI37596.1 hypothetical protein L969DRAFT_591006 [Mixia osmundae IAM 14324]GAA99697.1 hypothetical protein E5Q_06400 [Mixia osmundae IAM 14324]